MELINDGTDGGYAESLRYHDKPLTILMCCACLVLEVCLNIWQSNSCTGTADQVYMKHLYIMLHILSHTAILAAFCSSLRYSYHYASTLHTASGPTVHTLLTYSTVCQGTPPSREDLGPPPLLKILMTSTQASTISLCSSVRAHLV
jgi:hypothetical protein